MRKRARTGPWSRAPIHPFDPADTPGSFDERIREEELRRIGEDAGEQEEASSGSPATFVEIHAQPPTMYIFGFVDFASALAHLGKFLGCRVVAQIPARRS